MFSNKAIFFVMVISGAVSVVAQEPVSLRATHFTVPPSTGPVTSVIIQNLQDVPYEGLVQLELPEGWQWEPAEQAVALAPHETKKIPFTINKAIDVKANTYPVVVRATSNGQEVLRTQEVVCVSAPYFKPVIDGDLQEWGDSLPVRFSVQGKETVFRMYGNRRAFCLAVEVEEDAYKARNEAMPFDAVQFALAKGKAVTGTTGDASAERYEFLLVGTAEAGESACYALRKPGEPLSDAAKQQALETVLPGAKVVVKRTESTTVYECMIPFSAMPTIRATEGRELCFSLLVHDPDGTGVRDWGAEAGLWETQRNPFAWSSWAGVDWKGYVPFDGKIELGLCSSIH